MSVRNIFNLRSRYLALAVGVLMCASLSTCLYAKRDWNSAPWQGPVGVAIIFSSVWGWATRFVCTGGATVLAPGVSQGFCICFLGTTIVFAISEVVIAGKGSGSGNAGKRSTFDLSEGSIHEGDGYVIEAAPDFPWHSYTVKRSSAKGYFLNYLSLGNVTLTSMEASKLGFESLIETDGNTPLVNVTLPYVAFESHLGSHVAFGVPSMHPDDLYHNTLNVVEMGMVEGSGPLVSLVGARGQCDRCPASCYNGEAFTAHCDGTPMGDPPKQQSHQECGISWIGATYNWGNSDLAHAVLDSHAGSEIYFNTWGGIDSECDSPAGVA